VPIAEGRTIPFVGAETIDVAVLETFEYSGPKSGGRQMGAPDPRARGFIVVFHDSVEAELEAARLATMYGFQPRSVWTAALEGFSADLSREVVAELRCVPAVDYIEHEQVYTLG
jgi:hypothetical protein